MTLNIENWILLITKRLSDIAQFLHHGLTAKLVEVCLDLSAGVEEHSALFCADSNHAVLVHSDARHLGVEFGHGHALQHRGHDVSDSVVCVGRHVTTGEDVGRTTESRADTRLVRISCLADASGPCGSPREFVRTPSLVSFLI